MEYFNPNLLCQQTNIVPSIVHDEFSCSVVDLFGLGINDNWDFYLKQSLWINIENRILKELMVFLNKVPNIPPTNNFNLCIGCPLVIDQITATDCRKYGTNNTTMDNRILVMRVNHNNPPITMFKERTYIRSSAGAIEEVTDTVKLNYNFDQWIVGESYLCDLN